ncbi:MAG: hemagglutinin repeat-containing protein [Gammaproteobacteria bacterium]|nr:hemagglutinin repeat-containing protein [Gammaproteobacteria bacterium]
MVKRFIRKLPLIVGTAIYTGFTAYAGLVHSAGIEADGSTATDVTTVNQVDIVNIAPPSAGGVSQNHFRRFNIDSNGAVMNNSMVDGTSQLGGQVQANPNLSAGSAKIILNEVTSNRQSNLSGDTEIFGDNARYILSNPNGITCDGCGFIRTPTAIGDTGTTIKDVLLTTGTATVNPTTGTPITFTIDANNQAQLIIGQDGLDARNVDITTLLTRQAEINGLIDAASNQLNVYLGKGTLSVNDTTASTWQADSSGRTVNVAIDANSAGAMHAGQIFIQATEDGAGVTLPNDLISTNNITISAAGDIVYRDATAQAGDVSVTATGTNNNITSTGSTTASTNINLNATGDISYINATAQVGNVSVTTTGTNSNITSTGTTTASTNITLTATGDVSYNNATAQAGDVIVTTTGTSATITASGSTSASGNVTLNGTDDVSYRNATAQNGNVTVTTQTANAQISTSGNTTAGGDITWNVSGTRGRITGTGLATFNAGGTLLFNCVAGDGNCDIQSQRALVLQATILQSNASISTTSGNNLTINGAVSTSQGFTSGGNATFTSTVGNINIAGSLIAANNISLTSALNAQIILDGNVQAGGDISFLGQGRYTHDNVGTFNIGGTYQFDLFGLTNNAVLTHLQNGTLRVNELTNNGLIENQAALDLKVDDTLINTGIIASLEGAVSIGHTNTNLKTNSITNSGVIASIDLTNSQLGQTGLIVDPVLLTEQHTKKILNGEQRSAEDLANEIKTRNAALIAELNANATVTGVVTINANTLTNTASGRISGSDVSLLIDNLNNQGGQILAGRNLTVQGANLSNTNASTQFGVLTARDNLNIDLTGVFTNTGLVDGSYITINAPTQNNTGSGFSIASLLGAKLDTSAQINPLAQKPWFEAGTGDKQYQFVNAFNNTVIDSNLTRLSDAFIQSSGANIDANNQMVGDDVYIGELIVNTLRSNGGVPFVTSERDALGQLNTLYSNTQAYMTNTGLGFGQIPDAIQQSQITDPILVFVAQDQGNGDQVYVPQIWMPTSGEGINAQAGRINTQIIAANDLYLEGEQINNQDADLIAGDNLVIEAVDLNISGEERKWYVDATGKVHYRSAKVAAGDSVLVKLSGNYVQKGGQVLAANQVVVQAKKIDISNNRKASLNVIESFNHTKGKDQKLWQSLLSLGLTRADNMLANSVTLKAQDDIILTRATLRTGARTQTEDDEGKHHDKNSRHPHHEGKDDDDHYENTNKGDLTLIADNGSIANYGGYLESEAIYLQAGKDITNKSILEVKNNKTRVNGGWSGRRWSYYDDDDTRTYSQTVTKSQYVTTEVAEINAGEGGLVQIAGNDINNLGGIISSDANIVQQAKGNITNKSLATRYLENQTINSTGESSGWYRPRNAPRHLIENSSTTKYNTAIQLASVTAKGDLIQSADNKIINVGSTTKASGNIIQTAKKGIENKNLITSRSDNKYQRYIAPKYSSYDDDYYYYRRPVPKDTNTTTTTYQENINTINAGGSLVANVEEGDYLNQGNLSAKESIEVSANTIRNERQVVGKGNDARVIDSGKVTAGSDINFIAKNNIIDTAGRYDAGGNILLSAKENITQNTIAISKDHTIEKRSVWGYVYDSDRRTSITNTSGSFNSGGVTSLQAGKDLTLTGTDITANNIELRGENITLGAARNMTQRERRAGAYTIDRSVNYDVTDLNSKNNIIIQADNNLTTQGSILTAGNNADNYIMLDAKGDINFDAVNNETYSYYYHHRKRSWGRSSTTIRETQRIRSQGTKIAAENLYINANENHASAEKENNVNFIGSQLDIGNEAFISAQGDVNVYAALNFNYDMHESRKKGFGGFSSSSNGSRRSQQLLNATELSSRKGDLSLLSGNNITVVASNLTAGRDINLQADNDVLIAAAEQTGTYDEWSIKSGLFTSGDLYNSKEKRAGNTSTEYIGSELSAANDINIKASRAKIVGSTLLAANNIHAKTDVGDIEIITAANNEKSYQYEKEVSIGFGDFVKSLTRPDQAISTDNDRLTLKLADATYDEVDTKEGTTQNKSSVLQAENNITLDAAGDISIEGSQLIANTSENGQGDIALLANGDINIKEAKDRFESATKETHGKAEVSVVVQHQAVEVVNAVKALDEAKDQLKQANEDYRQYKKTLAIQKDNLAQLEADYKNKEVGVSYEDIQELREFIERAEDDKEWYEVGIAAATLNVTSKGTLLLQQTSAAAQSAVTWGFNAGVQLDIDATKTQAEQSQTASVASILQGSNIYLNNKGDSTIQGSHLQAANDLNINTNHLSILASRDTSSDNNKTEHGHITIAQTVWGATSGPTVNASFDRSRAENTQTTYNNSTLNAKNITLVTKGDATIRGGNVHASDTLVADIGKNLTIESVQNRTQGKNNSFSISGGFGKNDSGKVSSVNGGVSAGSGQYTTRETVLSSLTSGGTADVKVKEHTQLNGALLATVDEDNNDLGNLNLTTNSFGFEDLSNTKFSNNRNAGISTSVGLSETITDASVDKTKGSKTETKLNTSSVQYANSTGYEKTKTLATLGQGNITIANSDDSTLERLNRDTTQTNKDIYKLDRQQGNIDLTIDHRLFSAEGRKQIKDDYYRTKILGEAVLDLSKDGASFFGIGEEQTSFRENLIKKQGIYTALQYFASNAGEKLAKEMTGNKDLEGVTGKSLIEGITDGNATLQDKELSDTVLINTIAKELGIPPTQVKLAYQEYQNLKTREGRQLQGAYLKESDTIILVDNHNATTGDSVKTLGNEFSRHMDHVRDGDAAYTKTQKYRNARKSYSDIMGQAFVDYTSFAFAMNGYDSLTAANTFNGTLDKNQRPTKAVLETNKFFNSHDPNEIEYRQLHLAEGNLISRTASAFAEQNKITPEEGLKRLRAQALRQIDSDVLYQDGVSDKAASKWLSDLSVAFLKGREGNYDVELFNATKEQKDDHSLFAQHNAQNEKNFSQPLNNEANNWATTFVNSKYHVDLDQAKSNHSRLNALARVELRNEAFANGNYGENDLVYGFRDASNDLRAVNELNAYSRANGIVLNPNDIKRISNGQLGFNPEAAAAVEAFGLKTSLMNRDSDSFGSGWLAAEGQQDVFKEATRYSTKGSVTPLLVFNNGNVTDTQLATRVDRELGGYLTAPQQNIIHNAIGSTSVGQSLDLSKALEYSTAKTVVNNGNFVTDFYNYNVETAKNTTFIENPSAHVTQYTTGLLEQTGRNWEITFSDDKAPAYMKENAAAGVALDVAAIAPLVKTLRLGKIGKGGKVSDEIAALEQIKSNGQRNLELNKKINSRTTTLKSRTNFDKKEFDKVYAKAPQAKTEIDDIANSVAKEVDGKVASAPIKSEARAIEKIKQDYKGDSSKIKDLARNTIVTDNTDDAVKLLMEKGGDVKTISADSNPLGYSGYNVTYTTRAGIKGETQVNTPAMIYAKESEVNARKILGNDVYDDIAAKTGIPGGKGHELYEQWRVLDPKSPKAKAIAGESKDYYNSIRSKSLKPETKSIGIKSQNATSLSLEQKNQLSIINAQGPFDGAVPLSEINDLRISRELVTRKTANKKGIDFYVGPTGPESTLPSVGYRYSRYKNDDGTVNKYVDETFKTNETPGSYIGFENLNSGKEVRDLYQIRGPEMIPSWSDGRLKLKFDTLQLYNEGKPNVRVPFEKGDTGLKLEPITKSYPEYGSGGKIQLKTEQKIKLDSVEIIPED